MIASTFDDFKDGIVVCELVKALKGKSFGYDASSGLMNTPCVANMQIALNELKGCVSSDEVSEFSAEEISKSQESLFKLIKFLKKAFEEKESRRLDLPLLAGPARTKPEGTSPDTSPIQGNPLNSPFEVNMSPKAIDLPLVRTAVESKSAEELTSSRSTPRLQCENVQSPKEDRPLQMHNLIFKENSAAKKETISEKMRAKLLQWMEEIGLIKHGAVGLNDFAGYCRNGVLLSDLIHRIEGVTFAVHSYRSNRS